MERFIRFKFRHPYDLTGILYQTGWEQEMIFQEYQDFPVFNIDLDVLENAFGDDRLRYGKVDELCNITILNLSNSELIQLQSMVLHQQIVCQEIVDGLIVDHTEVKDVTLTVSEQDSCFSRAVIQFKVNQIISVNCKDRNYVVVPC